MKAEDLFRALGDVDPKYVEELLLEKNGAAEQKPETAGETTVVPLKPRRRRKVWLSAAAAVVALVSGVSLLSLMLLRGSLVPAAPSSSGSTEEGVPVWYAPGQLTVQTVTYTERNEVAFSAGGLRLPVEPMNQVQRYNQTIPFAPNAAVLSAENAVWLLLEDAAMVSGHEQCHGFLYHTETQEIICLTHLLAGRLTALDRGARLRVVGFNAQNQRCILTVRDPDSTQAGDAYFFNWATNELKPLPKMVAETAVQKDIELVVSANQRYVLAMDSFAEDQPASLYLIDTQQDLPAAERLCSYESFVEELYTRLQFSPNGQYVAYVDPEHEQSVKYYDYNWIMKRPDSGDSWKGYGRIIRFVQEEQAVVVDLGHDGVVYDTETGEDVTDTRPLADWEQDRVLVSVRTNRTHDDIDILTRSIFTGETRVWKTNVSAYCIRGSVLYTYTDGEDTVECLSLETGETFRASISPEYGDQVNALRGQYKITHTLDVSEDGTKLLLCFSCEPLSTVK